MARWHRIGWLSVCLIASVVGSPLMAQSQSPVSAPLKSDANAKPAVQIQPNQPEDLAPPTEVKPLTEAPPITEMPITKSDRDHWSIRPIARPEVPVVKDLAWPKNEIDHFILTRLEASGLEPLPPADRLTLIRRVTFDLTGLPPAPSDIDAFLADTSLDAYEQVVERLLSSRAFAEQSARHWLDLARFAESDGFEHNKFRPTAWMYRDWIISAFSDDLPYNRFVQLQLAGDELAPDDEQASIATGFCLAGPDMPDINLQDERRHVLLNEMTGTVGAVFMAQQFGCAECHDHKYDPISQADFYRLRAFFDNADVFGADKRGRVLIETSAKAKPSHLMIRGDFRRPGREVQPEFPRLSNLWGDVVPRPFEESKSTGRRTALANWMTRPDHPLTTRVIVNRLWQQHFSYGLSRSPSDFGILGDSPSHPELLDWLALELPRREWRLKSLHRLMVTSATYRTASRPTSVDWSPDLTAMAAVRWSKVRELDPENLLLARMPRQRLSGEEIRDAMLAASERLSPRAGGPGVMPPLPKELLSTLLKGQWIESPDEEDHRRRSIYVAVRRNVKYPLFDAFDRPDSNASCARRTRSTVAPQGLVLLNSEFSFARACDLAKFVSEQTRLPREQIELLFRRTVGRTPTVDELKDCERFFLSRGPQNSNEPDTKLSHLALALFNMNEFVYVD